MDRGGKVFRSTSKWQCGQLPSYLENAGNNIVFSKAKLRVALLGVNDLIVVQTEDAILVCNRHEVENVKKLVESLPEELQ